MGIKDGTIFQNQRIIYKIQAASAGQWLRGARKFNKVEIGLLQMGQYGESTHRMLTEGSQICHPKICHYIELKAMEKKQTQEKRSDFPLFT